MFRWALGVGRWAGSPPEPALARARENLYNITFDLEREPVSDMHDHKDVQLYFRFGGF